MLKSSLKELELIAKSRSIEGYKSISEDRLLSLNASKPVKENEKKLLRYRFNKR